MSTPMEYTPDYVEANLAVGVRLNSTTRYDTLCTTDRTPDRKSRTGNIERGSSCTNVYSKPVDS